MKKDTKNNGNKRLHTPMPPMPHCLVGDGLLSSNQNVTVHMI